MKTTSLLKTFLIVFSILFCLVSCEKENMPKELKDYKFTSVQFRLEEGDGLEIIELKLPEQVFHNTGTSIKKIVVNDLKEVYATSFFQHGDIDALNKWTDQKVLVSVPSEFELLSSSYKFFSGGINAPLIAGQEFPVPHWVTITHETDLPSNSKMTYNTTIYLKKITATYLATFTAEGDNFDSIEVKGKWTGTFVHDMDSKTSIEDIK